MKKLSGLGCFYLCWLAQPVADRAIYRQIKKRGVKSILEIGLGDGNRSEKLIQMAQKFTDERIRYAGIDQFDARSEDEPALSLIETHKRLTKTGAKIKLHPGDADSANAKLANGLAGTDLILVTMPESIETLQRFWFFLPRMVHDETLVLAQSGADLGEKFRIVKRDQWQDWADQQSATKKAA